MHSKDKIKVSVGVIGLAIIAALLFFLGRENVITRYAVIIIFAIWLITMFYVNKGKKEENQE